jgi:uncharacterized membrane protein
MTQHPGLAEHHRMKSVQDHVADIITRAAGSMGFVWLHIVAFWLWMVFIEHTPWPTLTLIVSLEAIFLSTFVLISQNRADVKRSAIADHDHEVDCEALALLKRIAEQMEIEP